MYANINVLQLPKRTNGDTYTSFQCFIAVGVFVCLNCLHSLMNALLTFFPARFFTIFALNVSKRGKSQKNDRSEFCHISFEWNIFSYYFFFVLFSLFCLFSTFSARLSSFAMTPCPLCISTKRLFSAVYFTDSIVLHFTIHTYISHELNVICYGKLFKNNEKKSHHSV